MLYLARHAESTANAEGWLSGWTNVDLTPAGIQAAGELARALRHEEVRGVITSDLLRAEHTATLVSTALGVELVHDTGLRERNYGDWTGTTYTEMRGARAADFHRFVEDETFAPPGGESVAEQRARAVEAIQRGLALWGDRFLVVSHRGTIKVLLAHIRGVSYGEAPDPPSPPGYLRVMWQDGRRHGLSE